MQLDLARIHFPKNLEEPFDVYQEKHFQIKQYFFQRAPIPVVVQKKIKELNELHEAYLLCYPEASLDEQFKPFLPALFTGNWVDDFHVLQNARTKYKTQLVALISAKNSALLLENWFTEELNYAQIWSQIYKNEDTTHVQVSQEPDPMRMLQWLRELPFNPSIENIEIEQENLQIDLQNELKRLSKFVALASK
jgi:hypothetical protein